MNFYERQDLLLDKNKDNCVGKKVAIIGAGGLGSVFAYALASIKIDELYIIDFDNVTISNIQRQIMFNFDDENLPKSVIFKKLENRSYAKISPFIMSAAEFFFQAEKNEWQIDLIIDATDNLSVRKEIQNYSQSFNIPWLYTGVQDFYASCALITGAKLHLVGDVKGLKAQCPPMVMFAASYASVLAFRYLMNLEVKTNHLYYFDLSKEQVSFNNFTL
ncbi:HesA/MoeB/ThiF family protein [Campylobacter canadensis]|uniref:ThiF family adenylyltransferase n=1 Tax=Campylobacter canadensis TaxID=449520 RepID=A0ABS7WS68_9BACT|nr:ThiF family adenylyltransferase [Campylobacter canadensis]MBZ7987599.1 ThiF family adenylyltransferase [Campylobacter canadensis]MBZ7994966.1 ThiF family adenylyltransferase [Campylobacter canadensis]MBZ7996884.1 ThiF family adenylyltransferase [Campylobacter canadensis]MBZ7998755.1 ThiF family adenylyltransferase [Campylobacter canadensis]MBZ8000363.1 ThiF family adenylyltransferase [Campylobacter canadensis]